jgi:hypothetical protein
MKIDYMDLLRKSSLIIIASRDSTKMVRKKVTGYLNSQMEKSTIVCSRMVRARVTEFSNTLMNENIMDNSEIINRMDLDS